MTVPVIIAVQGEREAVVAAALGGQSNTAVARRCADLSEALAAGHAGLGAVVVVSDQPQLNRAVVHEFTSAGVAVVGAPSSPEAADRLLDLGLAHVVADPMDSEAVVAAVLEAADDAPEPDEVAEDIALVSPDGPRGLMVAVVGPTGAPGRTTVAINLAAELGALSGNAVVVDVDTYGGAVAPALGLMDEAPGIAALARGALHGNLTDELIARHALAVRPGLRVLSGISRPDRWPELTPAALDPVWDRLRDHAAVTVVDAGFGLEQDEELVYDTRAPQRHGATLSALAAADVVVVVGSAEPVSIQRLVQTLDQIDAVSTQDSAERVVVVNRVRAAVAGMRPEEAVADALRRFAGVDEVWTVPFDAKACDAATLAGQVLAERSPRSSVRKAIAALARHLHTRVPAAQGAPPGEVADRRDSRALAADLTD